MALKVSWHKMRPWRRHSLVLLVAGAVYILVGLAYLLTPLTADRAQTLELALHISGGSIRPWGVVWLLVGAAAVISGRWPLGSEKWGYTALGAYAALWASVYLLGIGFLDTPLSGLSGALVWYLVAFLWWAIAGLNNPVNAATRGG